MKYDDNKAIRHVQERARVVGLVNVQPKPLSSMIGFILHVEKLCTPSIMTYLEEIETYLEMNR